jgi:hypothetical protein
VPPGSALAVTWATVIDGHGMAAIIFSFVIGIASRKDRCSNLRGQNYSMTSSARASSIGGTVRLSALAVLRLITSSYFVGACTGKSAGFYPLRIRST